MANRSDYIQRVRQYVTNEALPTIAHARALLEETQILDWGNVLTDEDFAGSDIDRATFLACVGAMGDIIGGISAQDGSALYRGKL